MTYESTITAMSGLVYRHDLDTGGPPLFYDGADGSTLSASINEPHQPSFPTIGTRRTAAPPPRRAGRRSGPQRGW